MATKQETTGGLSQLLQAINAVMQEVGYVQKSQTNKFHGYRYAGEADLLEVLRPAMIKHGLVLLPTFEGEPPQIDQHGNTHLVMSYTLAHISGEVWPTLLRMPGSGNDKNKNGVGEKGTFKAVTGANKYMLFKLFQIETGDDPEKDEQHNGNGHAEPAPAPAASPKDKTPEAFAQAVLVADTVKLAELDAWLRKHGERMFGRERADGLAALVETRAAVLLAEPAQ